MQPEQIDISKLPPELQALYQQTDNQANADIASVNTNEQNNAQNVVQPTQDQNKEKEEPGEVEEKNIQQILDEYKDLFLSAPIEDKILFIKSIL